MTKKNRGAVSVWCLAFAPVWPAFADEVQIPASKDNTLYADPRGSLSNAKGQHLFVGTNRAGNVRRGLIAFDIAGNIPAGSSISEVRLALSISFSHLIGPTVELRRGLSDWGEGTSMATGAEGAGAPATSGDATWLHTFWDSGLWKTPGGDFADDPSAAIDVAQFGRFTWSSVQMAADVQGWLDAPESNFGWVVLVADETARSSAKQLDSRENSDPALRPMLTVAFTPSDS